MNTKYTNTLYLVRHGENRANLTKEFSYKLVDYPLTPKGVLQAEQTAVFFQSTIPLNAAYVSPLKVNVGNFEMREPTEENWREHDQIFHQWFKGNLTVAFPGGENFLDLVARIKLGLLKATRRRDGERILIAAHGGSLSALIYTYCPREHSLINGIMDNCAITEIELLTSDDEILDGTLHSWASSAHLSGEAAQLVSPLLEYDRA
jgi:broad specificity phosphatase PhoE